MLLPTVEMVVNSLPNQSTGFMPFFLNYGREPAMLIYLIKGNEQINTESVASFVRRVTIVQFSGLSYSRTQLCN